MMPIKKKGMELLLPNSVLISFIKNTKQDEFQLL